MSANWRNTRWCASVGRKRPSSPIESRSPSRMPMRADLLAFELSTRKKYTDAGTGEPPEGSSAEMSVPPTSGSGAATTPAAASRLRGRGQRRRGRPRHHPPHPGDAGADLRCAGTARPASAARAGGGQRPSPPDVHDAHVDVRPGRDHPVTPMRTFPVIRDLVTDVSFNYERRAWSRRSRRPPICNRATTGCSRRTSSAAGVPQVASVLPVPEHLPRVRRPRGQQDHVRRACASSCGSPSWTCTRSTPSTAETAASSAWATATSPSAAPGVPPHPHHRQRADPDGRKTRRRPQVRPDCLVGQQALGDELELICPSAPSWSSSVETSAETPPKNSLTIKSTGDTTGGAYPRT